MTQLVVGGGLSGLVAASILARQGADRVVLAEAAPVAGGLLRSFDYGPNGCFDYGTHILSETGLAEVDAVMLDALHIDSWEFHAGPRRDPAGYYLAGELHASSPYLDLRSVERERWRRYVGELFDRIAAPPRGGLRDASEASRARFGDSVSRDYVEPVVEKVFRSSATDLDSAALGLVPLDRVVLFEADLTADLMKAAEVRSVVGYPDQQHLPSDYLSPRRAFYPKEMGMQAFVDGLVANLELAGVQVVLGQPVEHLEHDSGRITGATVGGQRLPVESVHWTSGLPFLARSLGLAMERPPDAPLSTVLVHIRSNVSPASAGLFYFYSYEPSHSTFRVTNYQEFCPGAVTRGSWPLTVELLLEDPTVSDSQIVERALDELVEMRTVDRSAVTFARVERLASGFPRLTTGNRLAMDDLRGRVSDLGLENLCVLGVLSEPGLFFQHDVLSSLSVKLSKVE